MIVCSADPGDTTALAVFFGTTPGVTSIAEPTPAFAMEFLSWLRDMADARGEELVLVIEDQHAKIHYVWNPKTRRREPTVNLPTLIAVIRSAEVWVVCATLLGIRVERVLAATWQCPMLRKAPKTDADGKTLTTKQRAKHVFAATWPEVFRFTGLPHPETMRLVKAARLNEHIRDCALMGRWFQLHGSVVR